MWSAVYLAAVGGMVVVGLRRGAVVAVMLGLLASIVGPFVAALLGATETGLWIGLITGPAV